MLNLSVHEIEMLYSLFFPSFISVICFIAYCIQETSTGTAEPAFMQKSSRTETLIAASNVISSKCLKVIINYQTEATYEQIASPYVYINVNEFQLNLFANISHNILDHTMGHQCIHFLVQDIPSFRIVHLVNNAYRKGSPKFWIITSNNMSLSEAFLSSMELFTIENIIVLVETRAGYKIVNRSIFSKYGIPSVKKIGLLSNSGAITNLEMFPEQMKNFHGTLLEGSSLIFKPFTDYDLIPNSRSVVMTDSLDYYILDLMSKQLNFTYVIKRPPDDAWGIMDENGEWNGIVGQVQHSQTNFSLVLSLTLERIKSMDFSQMYFYDPLTFVTAKKSNKPQWNKITAQFQAHMWAIVVLMVIGASILFYKFMEHEINLGETSISGRSSFMDIYGSFLSQTLEKLPSLNSSRIFISMWMIYGFIVTTYYKTYLTAMLAAPTPSPTLNTLTELYNSNLDYGMNSNKGSDYQLFSTSEVKLYQMLFDKMKFFSSDESMDFVSQGKYAYIFFQSNIEIRVATQFSDAGGFTNLHIAQEKFFPGGYAWAFPLGTPYVRTFNGVMSSCIEAGLLQHWMEILRKRYRKEELEKGTNKVVNQGSTFSTNDAKVVLNIRHLQGAFFALVLGYIMSIMFFVLEMNVAKFSFFFG